MKKILSIVAIILTLVTLASCGTNSNKDNGTSKGKTSINSFFEKETEPPTYWVSFQTNGGTRIDAIKTDNLTQVTPTTYEYHEFDGWYLDETLTMPAIFPMQIDRDTILYAKWLRIGGYYNCENATLKNWTGNNSTATYLINPNGFDMQELIKRGYKMEITVEYTVYYRKDYDVPLDVGYAGAPKYDIKIMNSQSKGISDENIQVNTYAEIKQFSLDATVADIDKNSWQLVFSTENIQNKVYFKDITISFNCYK